MRTLLFVISLVVFAISYGNSIVTTGSSGPICGNATCLANNESVCVNGECICNPAYKGQTKGDGAIACYKKNKIFSYIRGEPTIVTYDEHLFEFNLPCRYLATAFESELKIDRQVIGKCECEMYAWNGKHKGKMYPAGYDIACKIERFDGHENFDFSTRKSGLGQNGTYTHTANVVTEYRPHGPWGSETHIDYSNAGLVVKCNYNEFNNMARNHIRQCGFRVEFRPFDTTFGRYQRQANGLAWGLSCANKPLLRSNDQTISSAPYEHEGIPLEAFLDSTATESEEYRLTAKEFFTFQAILRQPIQNHPNANPECSLIRPVAELCDTDYKKKKASERCLWILTNQPFLRCIDKSDNGHVGLRLMKECFRYTCDDNLNCIDFTIELEGIRSECKPKFQNKGKFKLYLSGELCFEPGE